MIETVPAQVVHAILMHFAGATDTTRQRHGQWEEVPGSGSNARTSSFNLSYHQKTPGPPPMRPLQPSDSKCCMLLCVRGQASRWLRMRMAGRPSAAQQPGKKRQPRPPSSGGRCRPKGAVARAHGAARDASNALLAHVGPGGGWSPYLGGRCWAP